MLEHLKDLVCDANHALVRRGLVMQTFGNVSGVERKSGMLVIKPSGVDYDRLTPDSMVVVSLNTGKVVEGDLNPSSDTPTHRVLYQAFHTIGGVVHTHSLYATSWAQARRDIPAFGTTHADYCNASIPCTRLMTEQEIRTDYEANTGKVIVERFDGLNAGRYPGVLVASHGPFAWGASVQEAVDHAEVLEYLSRLANQTLLISPGIESMQECLQQKHFTRKNGSGAYYGQRETEDGRTK